MKSKRTKKKVFSLLPAPKAFVPFSRLLGSQQADAAGMSNFFNRNWVHNFSRQVMEVNNSFKEFLNSETAKDFIFKTTSAHVFQSYQNSAGQRQLD